MFRPVETKPLGSTETPRSLVLPDQFIFVLIVSGTEREVPGEIIPDDLPLGPDPIAAEHVLKRDEETGRLVVDEELRWMIDFDRAVALGMGAKIRLVSHEVAGLDRLLVIGLRSSSNAADGAARLEQLFEAHRFGAGMAIVPQGTATNNTEPVPSGFTSSNDVATDEEWTEQHDPALDDADSDLVKTDGAQLADALALPRAATAPLPNARGFDVAEAIAMNRALWGATFGGFLNTIVDPMMTSGAIDRLQRFFTTFVLGRGRIPAIRVANQPYGVVLASSLANWEWSEAETGDSAYFWNFLSGRLGALEGKWHALLPHVAFAGKPHAEPFANLLAILGLQASSVEFRPARPFTTTTCGTTCGSTTAATWLFGCPRI